MGKKFKVEIITPEREFFSGEAESLIVPAEHGYLGVLAGRAPLLGTLRAGEISIRRPDGTEIHFATAGGFLEVTPGKTTLLTESVEDVASIDVERARKALARAKERLASRDPSVDRERARAALERAQNRLRLASKYGRG